MDELDRLILRELGQGSVRSFVWPDFRLSARGIARKLGVPNSTVRDRIIKWTKSGFLNGTVLLLNPDLFNLHVGMLTLDASPPSRRRKSSGG